MAPDETIRPEPLLRRRKDLYVFYDSAGEAACLGKSAIANVETFMNGRPAKLP